MRLAFWAALASMAYAGVVQAQGTEERNWGVIYCKGWSEPFQVQGQSRRGQGEARYGHSQPVQAPEWYQDNTSYPDGRREAYRSEVTRQFLEQLEMATGDKVYAKVNECNMAPYFTEDDARARTERRRKLWSQEQHRILETFEVDWSKVRAAHSRRQ